MTQNPKSKPNSNRMKTLRTFRRGEGSSAPRSRRRKPAKTIPPSELSTKPNRNHCNRSNRIELRNSLSQTIRDPIRRSHMKRMLLWMVGLTLIFGTLATLLHAQDKDITGNWQGTLQAGKGLRTLIKISKDDGKLKAVMYSIDQGGQPIPVTSISLQGSSLHLRDQAARRDLHRNPEPRRQRHRRQRNPERPDPRPQPRARHRRERMAHPRAAQSRWPPMPSPKFDVVTVKPSDPNRPGKLFTIRGRHVMTINTTLNDLITFAYGLHAKQIVGAPALVRHRQIRHRRRARCRRPAELQAIQAALSIGPHRPLQTDLSS